MGADISRVRFDPRNDYNGVLQQQGRVALDADANEQQAITERRARAQAADLGSYGLVPGFAGTAVIPRTTPNAFALTMAAGVLSLGRGRMYVDGLLAENHGTGTPAYDPLLGEQTGSADTPYLTQPYWPTPALLPPTGRHLVYLDVWERELTWVERSDLVEPALAVDTTARTQVVWQVRVHAPTVPGLECDTEDQDIAGWLDLTAPSAGRLTVGTVPVAAAENPCSLPPTGDFRGLENQTYRIEIHRAGPAGTATFKWSRDNGSVTMPVTEFSSTSRLRLSSLGKDNDALGLKTGQWVEILDDHHELEGRPGEIVRITEIHDEDQSIVFAPALPTTPAGVWPTTSTEALARHLRVRRWDGPTGVTTIPAAATAITLEHGITVTLTAPGGEFHTGDYWVFAARTATGTVEKPVLAPPLGPRHHYARIGIIEGAAVVSPQCVPLWPPDPVEEDCDCTVCVTPEQHASGELTIQEALDMVIPTGGTVCLDVGTFALNEPLRIEKARGLRLRGQGVATTLLAKADAIGILHSAYVLVSDLAVVSSGGEAAGPDGGSSAAAGVRTVSSYEVALERLALTVRGEPGSQASGVKLHGMSLSTRIVDNDIAAPVGVSGWVDPDGPLFVNGLSLTDNTLTCATAAVAMDGSVTFAGATEVTGNQVVDATVAGLSLTGVAQPDALVLVSGNQVTSLGNGVVVGGGGMTVTGNTVICPNEGKGADLETVGIASEPSAALAIGSATQITHNAVSGFGRGIAVLDAGPGIHLCDNEVFETGDGISVMCKSPESVVHVSDNVVRDVAATESAGPGTVSGIRVTGARSAVVSGNTVTRVGAEWRSERPTLGIAVTGVPDCRLIGNSVTDVGPRFGGGSAVDFLVAGVGHVTVEGNQSLRDQDMSGGDGAECRGLLLRAGFAIAPTPRLEANEFTFFDREHSLVISRDTLVVQPQESPVLAATIGENTFSGSAKGCAVEVEFFGTVLLSHNQCIQPQRAELPGVRLAADVAAVTGNRVSGGRPSMVLRVNPERLTVLGNLVAAGIDVNGGGLDPRWVDLNLDGVL